MKPVALVIEGFTCFRDRTEIDLRGLDVFGISGPTGAGKSSILDAITFALFGRVVRVGKACASLISLGRDAMSVLLDFEVRGELYRVTRRLRRGASATTLLEHDDRSIASGVREVEARIESILGMPFETFTQAVLLPQGQFARFLGSTVATRTEILRDLLNLSVYDRMRKRADEKRRELDQKVKLIDDERGRRYAHATPAKLGELEALLASEAETITALGGEVAAAAEALSSVARQHERTRELDRARAALSTASTKHDGLAEVRAAIARAQVAEPFRVALAELDGKLASLASRKKAETRLAEAERRAREADEGAARALEIAEATASELGSIQQRIADLDRIVDAAHELADLRAELLRERRAVRDGERREKEAIDKSAGLARLADASAATEREAAAMLERGADLRAEADRIEPLVDEARAIVSLERDRGALAEARDRSVARLTAIDARIADDEARAAALKVDVELAVKVVEAARVEREARERAAHAEALRAGLHDGDACPVCEQTIAKAPARRATDVADKPAKKPKKKAAPADDPEVALSRAREEIAATNARLEVARQTRGEVHAAAEAESAKLRGSDEALARARAALSEKRAGEIEPKGGWAAHVLEKWPELRKQRAALDEARRTLDAARDRARALRDEIAAAAAADQARASEMAAIRSRVAVFEKRVAESEARIAAVTDAADPSIEREELEARRTQISRDVERRREERALRGAELSTARALHAESARETASLASLIDRAKLDLDDKTFEAGFGSIDDARAALRDPVDVDAQRRSIDDVVRAFQSATDEVAKLVREVGDAPVTDDDLARAKQRQAQVGARRDEALRAHASREQEIRQLARDIELASGLDGERAQVAKSRGVYADLASDLGTAQFQQHLQASVVRDLTAEASERLERLSRGRYRLEVIDDDFTVIDRENAGAKRPASTLSGGETFLASLALALALSDQIQRAAGAIRLDSLFIDEGFGTLDAEALDVAADAVEALQEGGRMVGIISHLPELNQRLAAELVVRRGSSGSATVSRRA